MIGVIVMALAALHPGQLSQGAIAQGLAPCGVAASDFSDRWDASLQETVVTLHKPAFKKDEMRCLAQASWTLAIDIEFDAPDLRAQYAAAQAATPQGSATLQQMRAENRAWLDQQGLLDGAMRIRAEKGSLADHAKKVEVLCGLMPGSVLQVNGQTVQIRPAPGTKLSYDQFHKLSAVLEIVAPENAGAPAGPEKKKKR